LLVDVAAGRHLLVDQNVNAGLTWPIWSARTWRRGRSPGATSDDAHCTRQGLDAPLADRRGEGTAERRALWWPPTKIAGRYLSPYLLARQESDAVGGTQQPDRHPADLDLELEVPSVADALRRARLRGEDERFRNADGALVNRRVQ
jgi:hypothetical protein